MLRLLTQIHVLISLVAILAGFVVLAGLLTARRMNLWNAVFLLMTVLTSVTGFFFPFHGFTPAIGFGIISLILLAVAIMARYKGNLEGNWRWIYIVTAMISQYLNVFVLVVQSFQKIPALNALAPTQSEPPFAITQLVVLVFFVVTTIIAVRKFHISN